jgi:hypothetical protein
MTQEQMRERLRATLDPKAVQWMRDRIRGELLGRVPVYMAVAEAIMVDTQVLLVINGWRPPVPGGITIDALIKWQAARQAGSDIDAHGEPFALDPRYRAVAEAASRLGVLLAEMTEWNETPEARPDAGRKAAT